MARTPRKITRKVPVGTPRDPWRGRRCKCCKLIYVPSERADARTADKSVFCSRKCKDGYHRNGGMDFEKFIDRAVNRIAKVLLADEKFLETISDKIRVKPEFMRSPSVRDTEHAASATAAQD